MYWRLRKRCRRWLWQHIMLLWALDSIFVRFNGEFGWWRRMTARALRVFGYFDAPA